MFVRRFRNHALLVALLSAALVLAGCSPSSPGRPAAPPSASAPSAPSAEPLTYETVSAEYDLGPTTLVQSSAAPGSAHREMPVDLNGVIAAPQEGGPYPVAVILHGMHPGCPVDANGVDSWPCDPADEQPNHAGFAWLAEELAARGMVALALNLNAEYTLGFGETTPDDRLEQLVDMHLRALGEASAGGDVDLGIDLTGRADTSQLLLVGHSRGGESAVTLASDWVGAPDGERPYGPAAGLLLLAPAVVFSTPDGALPAPTAIVLPSCDADVRAQDGMGHLESTRLADNDTWVTAAWVDGANHNNVNTTLSADAFALEGRPDCEPGLDPSTQRDVTGAYAADFATVLFDDDPQQVAAARARMGIDPATPAPATLYGTPAQVALLLPDDQRLPLLTPTGAEGLAADGRATLAADSVRTLLCPAGYYTPYMEPDLADCRRAQLTVPGDPALALASWSAPGGILRVGLPADARDLSAFTSLSVRAAVDPLSALNPQGSAQSFTIRMTDTSGASSSVTVGPDTPALRYPAGVAEADEHFEGQRFTGPAPLMPVRIPLDQFDVDLTRISEIGLVFDQTPTGALLLADLEVIR